jgi:hypothetical protein
MVAETLKKIWNKLRSKHVHRIVETGNQDFSHHTFATFCDNIPATSTTIADATQRQAVVSISEANSEYSFAISPTNSETFFEQQPGKRVKITMLSYYRFKYKRKNSSGKFVPTLFWKSKLICNQIHSKPS